MYYDCSYQGDLCSMGHSTALIHTCVICMGEALWIDSLQVSNVIKFSKSILVMKKSQWLKGTIAIDKWKWKQKKLVWGVNVHDFVEFRTAINWVFEMHVWNLEKQWIHIILPCSFK